MKFGYFAKVAIIKYLKFVGPLCAKTLKNLTCSHTSNHQRAIQRSYIGLYTLCAKYCQTVKQLRTMFLAILNLLLPQHCNSVGEQ